jgi:Tfp pilus assembly protein PilX
MRISPPFESRARRGYALIITLVFLTVTLLTLASLMWWASSNGQVTQQNELFTTAESAADAAAEQVVATMDRDWTYGQALQSASVYAGLTLPVQTA